MRYKIKGLCQTSTACLRLLQAKHCCVDGHCCNIRDSGSGSVDLKTRLRNKTSGSAHGITQPKSVSCAGARLIGKY